MNKLKFILGTNLLSVFFGCATPPNDNENIVIVSSVIKKSLSRYAEEMQKNRNPIVFSNNNTAYNCIEYFTQQKNADIKEGINNQIIAQEYVLCDTLRLLNNSKNTIYVKNKNNAYGSVFAHRVAIDSYPSSFFQRTEENRNTLMALFETGVKIEKHSASINTNDWYYQLQLIATADFDNDGSEDWLVWLTDKAKTGNYDTLSAFYISNAGKKQGEIELKSLKSLVH